MAATAPHTGPRLVLAAGSGGGIVRAAGRGPPAHTGLGLARSFLVLAAILAAAAIPGVWHGRRWLAALLLLASLAFAAWCWNRPQQNRVVESLLWAVGSANQRRCHRVDDRRSATNRSSQAARAWRRDRIRLSSGTGADDEDRHKSALVIGLGGGLAPRLLAMHGIRCETVEIDPEVVEIARREFAFTGDATLGDGRAVLARTKGRYDLIFLDACTADRLPWHLFTLEAMQLVRDRLTPTGMLAIQFIGDDGPWSASLVRTVDAAFGPRRSVLLASAAASSPVGLRWLFVNRDTRHYRRQQCETHSRFARWRQIDLPAIGWLLTDDYFPAELAWAQDSPPWRRSLRRKTMSQLLVGNRLANRRLAATPLASSSHLTVFAAGNIIRALKHFRVDFLAEFVDRSVGESRIRYATVYAADANACWVIDFERHLVEVQIARLHPVDP